MVRQRTATRALAVGVGVAGATALVVALTATAAAPPPARQTGTGPSPRPSTVDEPARSVIFINGDGMGAAHRAAARLHLVGPDGALEMDRLAVSGTLTTDPDDPQATVTDSAAGASAWATGKRTYNGAVSVDAGRAPLPVLGQQAKAAGKATGLVTTAPVTDASPAAFFARTPDRGQQDAIAAQYLEFSRPDVILGGGEDWWLPEGTGEEGGRSTKGDLVAAARAAGYTHVSSADGLAGAQADKLLGLFADEAMFQKASEGQGDEYDPVVDLATMTRKALDTLGPHPEGFFLFVEEEGIDEFAHANNAEKVLLSMQRLDAAVAIARAYVAEHPGTLLVVTGDHETGGMSVEDAGEDDSAEDGPFPVAGTGRRFAVDWTTGEHTGAAVPVTAEGPDAERFTGQHPNTFVHQVLTDALDL